MVGVFAGSTGVFEGRKDLGSSLLLWLTRVVGGDLLLQVLARVVGLFAS